ncbi:unnamed protein product [Amoebophrya sp. A25]|nr:unnamed protein product [Amoebophrya sp. A25]|eukprot:GSA25T00022593001.1
MMKKAGVASRPTAAPKDAKAGAAKAKASVKPKVPAVAAKLKVAVKAPATAASNVGLRKPGLPASATTAKKGTVAASKSPAKEAKTPSPVAQAGKAPPQSKEAEGEAAVHNGVLSKDDDLPSQKDQEASPDMANPSVKRLFRASTRGRSVEEPSSGESDADKEGQTRSEEKATDALKASRRSSLYKRELAAGIFQGLPQPSPPRASAVGIPGNTNFVPEPPARPSLRRASSAPRLSVAKRASVSGPIAPSPSREHPGMVSPPSMSVDKSASAREMPLRKSRQATHIEEDATRHGSGKGTKYDDIATPKPQFLNYTQLKKNAEIGYQKKLIKRQDSALAKKPSRRYTVMKRKMLEKAMRRLSEMTMEDETETDEEGNKPAARNGDVQESEEEEEDGDGDYDKHFSDENPEQAVTFDEAPDDRYEVRRRSKAFRASQASVRSRSSTVSSLRELPDDGESVQLPGRKSGGRSEIRPRVDKGPQAPAEVGTALETLTRLSQAIADTTAVHPAAGALLASSLLAKIHDSRDEDSPKAGGAPAGSPKGTRIRSSSATVPADRDRSLSTASVASTKSRVAFAPSPDEEVDARRGSAASTASTSSSRSRVAFAPMSPREERPERRSKWGLDRSAIARRSSRGGAALEMDPDYQRLMRRRSTKLQRNTQYQTLMQRATTRESVMPPMDDTSSRRSSRRSRTSTYGEEVNSDINNLIGRLEALTAATEYVLEESSEEDEDLEDEDEDFLEDKRRSQVSMSDARHCAADNDLTRISNTSLDPRQWGIERSSLLDRVADLADKLEDAQAAADDEEAVDEAALEDEREKQSVAFDPSAVPRKSILRNSTAPVPGLAMLDNTIREQESDTKNSPKTPKQPGVSFPTTSWAHMDKHMMLGGHDVGGDTANGTAMMDASKDKLPERSSAKPGPEVQRVIPKVGGGDRTFAPAYRASVSRYSTMTTSNMMDELPTSNLRNGGVTSHGAAARQNGQIRGSRQSLAARRVSIARGKRYAVEDKEEDSPRSAESVDRKRVSFSASDRNVASVKLNPSPVPQVSRERAKSPFTIVHRQKEARPRGSAEMGHMMLFPSSGPRKSSMRHAH